MSLKRAFAGIAALVLGLSLSPAFGANLLVDNFADLGAIPSSSNNTWFYAPASGTLQNARDLSKNNGSSFQWGSAPSGLKMTSTVAGSTLQADYDGNVGSASNQFFTPRVNASAYSSGWLHLLTPTVSVQANTIARATIVWFSAATGGTRTTSSLTLNGGPTSGAYSFKLSDFSTPISNLSYIGQIQVRLQNLGIGSTTLNSLYFANAPIPEPSTVALAGLGLVGLVMARRKTRG